MVFAVPSKTKEVLNIVKTTTTADLTNVNTTYDDSTDTANSQTIDCETRRKFSLFYTLARAGTPTDIRIIVQFSQDGGTTFFDYMNWFFGDLRFDDTAVGSDGINEVVTGDCIAEDMRIRVVATGTTASNTFTVSNMRLNLKN